MTAMRKLISFHILLTLAIVVLIGSVKANEHNIVNKEDVIDALKALRAVQEEQKRDEAKIEEKNETPAKCQTNLVKPEKKQKVASAAVVSSKDVKMKDNSIIYVKDFSLKIDLADLEARDSVFMGLTDIDGKKYRIWCDKRDVVEDSEQLDKDKLNNSIAELGGDSYVYIFSEYKSCVDQVRSIAKSAKDSQSYGVWGINIPHAIHIERDNFHPIINMDLVQGNLLQDDTGFVYAGKVVSQKVSSVNPLKMIRDSFEHRYAMATETEMDVTVSNESGVHSQRVVKFYHPNFFSKLNIYNLRNVKGVKIVDSANSQQMVKNENEIYIYKHGFDYAQDLEVSLDQFWQDSDLTYFDILEERSFYKSIDYSRLKVIGEDRIANQECFVFEINFKVDDSSGIYSKMLLWVSKKDSIQLKSYRFDKDMKYKNSEEVLKIENFNGRSRPVLYKIESTLKSNSTMVQINSIKDLGPVDSLEFYGIYLSFE